MASRRAIWSCMPTSPNCGRPSRRSPAGIIDWAAAQSEATLAEQVRFRFIGGEESTMRRGAILLHVVNHATYHRGWIAEMFFQVPARNPATDLPVFLNDPADRQLPAQAGSIARAR